MHERQPTVTLGYLLTLSRPRFWFYLAGPVLVGVAYGASAVSELFAPAAVALFAYFLVPANVYLYGVNDAFDADIDVENPKKTGEQAREARFRGGGAVAAVVAACGLAGLALAGAFAAGALALYPNPPAGATVGPAAWVVAFLALGYAYSAPPFRLKTVPPLDSVSNGLYVLPGAAAFVAVAGHQPPALAVVGGWLWAMAMHTFSAIPDIEPDRRAGIRTTATVLGERRTLAYCGAVWLLAAGAFGLLDWRGGALLLVYPLLAAGVAATDVAVSRAYWWFPAVNGLVGMVLTLGGLWGVVRG
ncbi:prenyltransferase [Halorussus gelatinilyticus]|uniref:Prenyltransferase n=1 Tax=Halorussus gelatinilyticus TaxID=2937524 RepID=A0A8U0IED3_9EURY|nr:prenyltransferase [Halorussus gelatinilyticus]UPV99426.1 prenyltransferase [Halorussus gelatinilyticus]